MLNNQFRETCKNRDPCLALEFLFRSSMEMRIFTGDLRTNPGGSDGKESPLQCRRHGSIPGSGRSPGEVDGNPLQYSCLENPMDRGAWQATVHGVAKSQI